MRRIMVENERQRTKEEIHQDNIQQKKMEVLHEFFAQNGDS